MNPNSTKSLDEIFGAGNTSQTPQVPVKDPQLDAIFNPSAPPPSQTAMERVSNDSPEMIKGREDNKKNIVSGFKDAMTKIKSSYISATDASKNKDMGIVEKTGKQLEGGLGIASGLYSAVQSPITGLVKTFIDNATDDPKVQKLASNPLVAHALDTISAPLNHIAEKHPELATNLSDILNVFFSTLGAQELPGQLMDFTKSMEGLTKNAVGAVKDTAGDLAGKAKNIIVNKIPASEDINTTVGKVAQGKTTDVPTFRDALSKPVLDETGAKISEPLDTSSVKTYEDLHNVSTDKIKEISAKQDEILSKDKTPRKVQQLTLDKEVGGKTVAHNYVIDAVDNLEELYSKTNDPVELQKIKDIKTKLDPVKGTGLTLKEVNDIARQYNTEFGSKAFSARSGEPLTSVNAQGFENTRSGLKNTVRDLLPDNISKSLDEQMTNMYDVKDLSKDMMEKVNRAYQRLQSKNMLQKFGSIIGKGAKITGVGDLFKSLMGLENTPGATSLSPVEIEANLSKNLSRITKALSGDDANFISNMKDIIKHPK